LGIYPHITVKRNLREGKETLSNQARIEDTRRHTSLVAFTTFRKYFAVLSKSFPL
jgi:hypothetical protein